jgi:hypothetical protein
MAGEQGGLGGLVSQILSFITGILGTSGPNIWSGMSGVADQSFSSLNNSFLALGDAVAKIKSVFESVWNQVILAMLKKLLDAYTKLRNLLQRIFGPVVNFLHQLRRLYDQYFNQFVKPVLNIIRNIRKFLQIFKLLGFKWAARLDARLADIENKIIKAYETLRQNLNQVTSWLQLVIDPTFILRRNPLFAAIIRSAPELRNLMLTSVTRQLTPDEQAANDAARGRFTLAGQQQRQQDFYSNGLLPDDVQAAQQDFKTRASAYLNS